MIWKLIQVIIIISFDLLFYLTFIDYITLALDLIRQNPGFKWQSECILFLRAWLNFFPNREWEIIQRMKDGSFDIGLLIFSF